MQRGVELTRLLYYARTGAGNTTGCRLLRLEPRRLKTATGLIRRLVRLLRVLRAQQPHCGNKHAGKACEHRRTGTFYPQQRHKRIWPTEEERKQCSFSWWHRKHAQLVNVQASAFRPGWESNPAAWEPPTGHNSPPASRTHRECPKNTTRRGSSENFNRRRQRSGEGFDPEHKRHPSHRNIASHEPHQAHTQSCAVSFFRFCLEFWAKDRSGSVSFESKSEHYQSSSLFSSGLFTNRSWAPLFLLFGADSDSVRLCLSDGPNLVRKPDR